MDAVDANLAMMADGGANLGHVIDLPSDTAPTYDPPVQRPEMVRRIEAVLLANMGNEDYQATAEEIMEIVREALTPLSHSIGDLAAALK